MARCEDMIRQCLMTLEEGREFTEYCNYYIEGRPVSVTFYDKKNKGCIAVDVWQLDDAFDRKDSERLAKYVLNRPKRFIELPSNSSSDEFEIMCEFAEEKEIAKLKNALSGRRPWRTFNFVVTELGLFDEWCSFRDRVYNELFEKWKKANKIKEN